MSTETDLYSIMTLEGPSLGSKAVLVFEYLLVVMNKEVVGSGERLKILHCGRDTLWRHRAALQKWLEGNWRDTPRSDRIYKYILSLSRTGKEKDIATDCGVVRKRVSPFSTRGMAELLVSTLKRWSPGRASDTQPEWEGVMQRLVTESGIEPKIIWRVVRWYCLAIRRGRTRKQRKGRPYILYKDVKLPRVYNAKQFDFFFPQLYELWGETINENEVSSQLRATVDYVVQEAQGLLDQDEVLDVLYKSEKWFAKLRRVCKTLSRKAASTGDLRISSHQRQLVEFLNYLTEESNFPELVGQSMIRLAHEWSDWSGNLGGFLPGGKFFVKLIDEECQKYTCEPLKIWSKWMYDLFYNRDTNASSES